MEEKTEQKTEQKNAGEKKQVKKKTKKKTKFKQKAGIIQTIGKRKRAIARATLLPGKGIIRINSQILENYNPPFARKRIMEPLQLAGEVPSQVDIMVIVKGGGWQGQTEAIRLAIAKALVEFDKKLKKVFADYDKHLLVADVRFKEAYKPNDSKARASRQFSKR